MSLNPKELEPEVLEDGAQATSLFFKASSAISAAGIIIITGIDDAHPTAATASSAALSSCKGKLYYTKTGVGSGEYGVARNRAVISLNTTGAAIGDPVYLSTAGAVSLTAGTVPIVVGQVLSVGSSGQVLFESPAVDVSLIDSGASIATLSGDLVLVNSSPKFQALDPGGSSRNVTLPAIDLRKSFYFKNAADAAENLVIKNAGGSTIVTLNQNEAAWVFNDGTNWTHGGVLTIAQT